MLVQFAVRIRTRLITDPLAWNGRNPITVRSRETCAQAQPEDGYAKIAPVVFPLLEGGLLLRTLNLSTTSERKTMNNIIINIIAIAAIVGAIIGLPWLLKFRRVFLVPEGYAGLLYHKGKFVETLGTGRHIRWGRHFNWNALDMRKQSLTVAGQEVLSADNVGLKASLLLTFQVIDPAKAAHETQNWQGDLYNAAQIALRAVIGGAPIEALLGQRLDLGAQLLARVKVDAEKIGVNVLAVEIRDVTLPNDLKRAFADVLKAKQEGQAALERARGESAALRNLANGARVLEGNPALMNLRLMQSLAAAQHAGNTFVLGMPGGFVPLKQSAKPANREGNETT
jgi:regulator of protease activity HflC (stomatin/prohibitin superfamily)